MTEDLVQTNSEKSSKQPRKGGIAKTLDFLRKSVPVSLKPEAESLGLTMNDFRFLNFQDSVCPKKIFKHLLSKKKKTCDCPESPLSIAQKYSFLLDSRCLECAYIPNRKLVVSLFIRTGTKANCETSVLQVKTLTDCSLFVGGFTGKDQSSYLLLGNSHHDNFLDRFDIKRVYKRGRKNDTEGFEVIGAEELSAPPENPAFNGRSSIWEMPDLFPSEGNWGNSSNRKSSFIRDSTPEEEIRESLFNRSEEVKLFFLDPHYIQVTVVTFLLNLKL